ncbi:MAG TPA: hypothetical protein VMT55_01190 [Candidatus Sulfotelmatobacter sp.]|nr:hypothetical protein [Candidatus Sulfotelmatobacter sp.]
MGNAWLVSLQNAWLVGSPLVLKLLAALVIFFLGYLIAKGLGWLAATCLKAIMVDVAAKKIGLAAFIEKGDIKKSASDLVGELIYWIVIFVTIIGVAKVLGIPVKAALVMIFGFIGKVFLVAVILGAGLFLASLTSAIVKVMAVNFGIDGAKTFARTIYYIVVIFALLAVLAELGIKTELIASKLDVIIGAVGLAAAIAYGLGCKDMAADSLHNLFKGK